MPWVALLLLSLGACGGSSSGSGAPPPPSPTPTPPSPGSDASLARLTFGLSESFDQPLQAGQTVYTATVGYLVHGTYLVYSLADPDASVSVNGGTAMSGQDFFHELLLAPGLNGVVLDVTAEDGATTQSYSITITRESAAEFAQDAYVKASNTGGGDRFGSDIALWGNTLAVGASFEDSAATGIGGNQSSDAAPDAGAVYVFTRDAAGTWSQQAYLKASNTSAGDRFGASVALAGDVIAVGARGEDSAATGVDGDQSNDNAPDAGAVYVFTRDASGTWSQTAYLKASNAGSNDAFGASVALVRGVPAVGASGFGYTLAVGAIGESSDAVGADGDQSNDNAADAGAVYVYRDDSTGPWVQQAYLKASNSGAGDLFGLELALFDDTLAVGAYLEDSAATGVGGDQSSDAAPDAGAVYLFSRDTQDVWAQSAYVKASNAEAGDRFGRGLALGYRTLAVGAHLEDGSGTGVDADEADNAAPDAGAVYVFEQNSMDAWSQTAYLKASNADAVDWFGIDVTLFNETLAVGALAEASSAVGIEGDQNDDAMGNAGAAYVFNREYPNGWLQRLYLKASNTHAAAGFGSAVALDRDTLAVASEFERGSGTGVDPTPILGAIESGAVYVLR